MSDVNATALSGYVATEPEEKLVGEGVPLLTFRLGTTRVTKDQSGKYVPMFVNVVAWRELAERWSNGKLKKGSKVWVSGSIDLRTYKAASGEEKISVEVIAASLIFATLGVREDSTRAGGSDTQTPVPRLRTTGNRTFHRNDQRPPLMPPAMPPDAARRDPHPDRPGQAGGVIRGEAFHGLPNEGGRQILVRLRQAEAASQGNKNLELTPPMLDYWMSLAVLLCSHIVHLDASFAARLMRLTLLAPDVIEAILGRREPDGLSMGILWKPVPTEWEARRARSGSSH